MDTAPSARTAYPDRTTAAAPLSDGRSVGVINVNNWPIAHLAAQPTSVWAFGRVETEVVPATGTRPSSRMQRLFARLVDVIDRAAR